MNDNNGVSGAVVQVFHDGIAPSSLENFVGEEELKDEPEKYSDSEGCSFVSSEQPNLNQILFIMILIYKLLKIRRRK